MKKKKCQDSKAINYLFIMKKRNARLLTPFTIICSSSHWQQKMKYRMQRLFDYFLNFSVLSLLLIKPFFFKRTFRLFFTSAVLLSWCWHGLNVNDIVSAQVLVVFVLHDFFTCLTTTILQIWLSTSTCRQGFLWPCKWISTSDASCGAL